MWSSDCHYSTIATVISCDNRCFAQRWYAGCDYGHGTARFITKLGQPIIGTLKKVTLSAGVATFGPDGRNAAELIGKADRAAYQAKRDGRDRVSVSI